MTSTLLRALAPGYNRDQFLVQRVKKDRGRKNRGSRRASHLKGDVIELAAAADGRAARVHHAVHRNDARAALRGSPGPFPGGAPRRGAASCGFAFYSLLARHFPEVFQKRASLDAACDPRKKRNPVGKVLVCPADEPWNLAPLCFWVRSQPAPALVAPLALPALPSSADGRVRAGANWRKTAPGAQSSQGPAITQEEPEPPNITHIVFLLYSFLASH